MNIVKSSTETTYRFTPLELAEKLGLVPDIFNSASTSDTTVFAVVEREDMTWSDAPSWILIVTVVDEER